MTCHLRNTIALLFCACAAVAPANGGETMPYYPDSTGAICCVNGSNLYTRALYGSDTYFRLETGDRPVFAAIGKNLRRNISFSVDGLRLDSADYCLAAYADGCRRYLLTDPRWQGDTVYVTALAPHDSESAIFRITGPTNGIRSLQARCLPTQPVRFSRNGDLGVDDPAGYEAAKDLSAGDGVETSVCRASLGDGTRDIYILYADGRITADGQPELAARFAAANQHASQLSGRITIDTPDPYINSLGNVLSNAAEAIWDGETYLHGAIGWRTPLPGWRGAYAGDFTGSHDRAASHFSAYAASQVRGVLAVIPHPAQDSVLNLSRAAKCWGTPMYSDGYICRDPGRTDRMHHYDMDLCYLDALLWHLQWTGDKERARELWPVIESALEWERRNYDPDGDNLYDAYACIWASDALYYSGGAVTHSTALNHRANLLAAKTARLIGEDPTPYERRAQAIRAAMDSVLYMPGRGVWAECRDLMGERLLHPMPALWTVYNAIDGECASAEQAYNATRYVDRYIPRFDICSETDGASPAFMLATSRWQPYAWSINNVAFAENYHTALAYWQANRPEQATALLRGAVINGMYQGRSPGNVGQISSLDAARGECYRDFADPVGVLSRAVVQGLFGFTPRALDACVEIRPGFPADWERAEITHPDFKLSYKQPAGQGDRPPRPVSYMPSRVDTYSLSLGEACLTYTDSIVWRVPALHDLLVVNGGTDGITPRLQDAGTPYATYRFATPASSQTEVNLEWYGDPRPAEQDVASQISDPAYPGASVPRALAGCDPVDLTGILNSSVTDIFRNRYESPAPPCTTLRLPVQGIGEWCHPKDSASIDDRALRTGRIVSPQGIVFDLPATGHNTAFVSLFDNYPDSVSIPIGRAADGVALLMAGSTNHMQCYVPNATITVSYADGTRESTDLVPPFNWAPIDQDYYRDTAAFRLPDLSPCRISMKDGVWSDGQSGLPGLGGPSERRVDGGAATMLYLPLRKGIPVNGITLRARANDTVTGILAATLIASAGSAVHANITPDKQ